MVIELTDPTQAFSKQFNDLENKRIVFSGRFGSGKTYFLKNYFEDLVNRKEVNTFWLSPVKYATSQNEDIFEYIKVDIANQLLVIPTIYKVVKNEYPESLYIDQFLKSKGADGVKLLINLVKGLLIAKKIKDNGTEGVGDLAETAGLITTPLENLLDISGNYKRFKEEINKKLKPESELLSDYTKSSVDVKGSVFENDVVTEAIQAALELCLTDGVKQNVLIIDDFDRLDPEHIFRILNILSVHNDTYETDNKFGFDKIIIVYDIKNIELIYKHKYGKGVDFEGYMAKFYTTQIFYFKNIDAVQSFCKTALKELLKDDEVEKLLGLLLSYFVKKGKLTIRNVIKYRVYKVNDSHKKYGPYSLLVPAKYSGSRNTWVDNQQLVEEGVDKFYITSNDYPFIQAIRVLCLVFGNFKEFKKAFKSIDTTKDSYDLEYNKSIYCSLLPLLHHAKNSEESYNLSFSYRVDEHRFNTLIGYPEATIFNKTVRLYLNWNSVNKYDGKCSYYSQLHNNLKNSRHKEWDENKNGSFKELFVYLTAIIDFLDQSGTLSQVGITTHV